jgi:threonine synthase
MVQLVSTKGGRNISFRDALLKGFAADGGLVMPLSHPVLTPARLQELRAAGYWGIVEWLLTQYACGGHQREGDADSDAVLTAAITGAVRDAAARFDTPPAGDDPVPLAGPFADGSSAAGDGQNSVPLHVMELHHGPTLAFKDLGLQVIAALMDRFLEQSGEVATLLVATSGDTGSAALRYVIYILLENRPCHKKNLGEKKKKKANTCVGNSPPLSL